MLTADELKTRLHMVRRQARVERIVPSHGDLNAITYMASGRSVQALVEALRDRDDWLDVLSAQEAAAVKHEKAGG